MAASRGLICVRLATYESQAEADLLTSIFLPPSGQLENTTFALLAPDGKTRLGRAGRGPQWMVGRGPGGRRGPSRGRGGPSAGGPAGDAQALADLLKKTAAAHPGTRAPKALPQSLDFRRALNVAACDNQPLVVIAVKNDARRKALEGRVAKLAWSERFVGRFQYAVVEDRGDLDVLTDAPRADGVWVVQPGTYGLKGRVLSSVAATADDAALEAHLDQADRSFNREAPSGGQRSHVRTGQREGIRWEPEIEVTDPHVPPDEPGRRRRR